MTAKLDGTNGVTFPDGTTQATAAQNGLGVSQTYQNVTASRALSVTYTNSTGRAIWVWYSATNPTSGATASAYVNGALACYTSMDLYPRVLAGFVVPNGATYSITSSSNLGYWLELR